MTNLRSNINDHYQPTGFRSIRSHNPIGKMQCIYENITKGKMFYAKCQNWSFELPEFGCSRHWPRRG